MATIFKLKKNNFHGNCMRIHDIKNLYLVSGIEQLTVKYHFRTNIHKPLNYCVMNKNTYCTHETAQIERPEENIDLSLA